MSSYSYFNYPNPTSIGPYKPGYQDTFQNQQYRTGSKTSYGLNAFSGSGTTRFNVDSSLPVVSAVVDKFDPPLQFKSSQYSQVLNYLMTRSLDMAQGLPYNLYASNGGNLFQLGSQNYNILQPSFFGKSPRVYTPQAMYAPQAYAAAYQQPTGYYPQAYAAAYQ